MNPHEVYDILKAKGIDDVYHANSVLTAETYLMAGSLLSRGNVESKGLAQTKQRSDDIDKRFGVWDDVFVDTDDYHRRIRNVNHYGPVAFVLRTEILTSLPDSAVVLVTRKNPTKWRNGEAFGNRYFTNSAQLAADLTKGTFDQMITIRDTPSRVDFNGMLRQLLVDNPQKELDGVDVIGSVIERLGAAMKVGGVDAEILVRSCDLSCKCAASYKDWRRYRNYY